MLLVGKSTEGRSVAAAIVDGICPQRRRYEGREVVVAYLNSAPNPEPAKERDAIVPEHLSPLALFHPDGVTARSVVIGSKCPTVLLPAPCSKVDEHADLVLLTPTIAECCTKGWLEEAVQVLVHMLTPDGVAYTLAPAQWRARIMSLLRRQGLSIGPLIAHLPDWEASRYLVPLTPIPAWYAFSQLIPIGLRKRFLTMAACRLPGGKPLLARMVPAIGLIARRSGSRPLFDWLFQLGRERHPCESAIISTRRRGQTGTAVLLCFSGGGVLPSVVAKRALTMAANATSLREATLLTRLGPGVQNAGARIPQPLRVEQIAGHSLFLQATLSGQSIASLLALRPGRLLDLMERVVCWLERWNRSTMVVKPLDRTRLDQALLAPAALLTPFLEQGEEYRQWLAMRCALAVGVPIPLVSMHGDLTMSNILVDGHGHLGIVDWETGQEEGLPLVDFFYAMADAVAATQGYADRPKAFAACFVPGGIYMSALARLRTRLTRALKIPADVADLCFHACWLHHAANEHNIGEPPERRRFLKIVQWLALQRSCTEGWMHE